MSKAKAMDIFMSEYKCMLIAERRLNGGSPSIHVTEFNVIEKSDLYDALIND